jgi:hypothetical protein
VLVEVHWYLTSTSKQGLRRSFSLILLNTKNIQSSNSLCCHVNIICYATV